MPTPRRVLVDAAEPGFYHCVSRCVRRAFLCGDGFDHRRDWIRDELIRLSGIYAIDVAAYAVMHNHFHTVVRTDPHRAERWRSDEVVRRWARLHPASIVAWAKSLASSASDHVVRPRGPGSGVPISDDELETAIAVVAKDERQVQRLRSRLSSLSELMKSLKEPIARRANREDECSGCFWEGRFKSPRLLDDAAVLFGMIYVDLNLVRAALASTPEGSGHTSVQDRIHVLQHFQKHVGRRLRAPRRARGLLTRLEADDAPSSEEDGIWLAPIDRDAASRLADPTGCAVEGVLPMTLTDYLELVDATGRMTRDGKRGVIPAGLPPILSRLGLSVEGWSKYWSGATKLVGSAIGSTSSLAKEAERRNQKSLRGVADIYEPS